MSIFTNDSPVYDVPAHCTMGRCTGICDQAYYWTSRSTAPLSLMTCPQCGEGLQLTTRRLRSGFRLLAPAHVVQCITRAEPTPAQVAAYLVARQHAAVCAETRAAHGNSLALDAAHAAYRVAWNAAVRACEDNRSWAKAEQLAHRQYHKEQRAAKKSALPRVPDVPR